LGYDFVEIENLGREHLLAAESKELACQRCCALGCIGNFLRRSTERRIGTEALEQELGIAGDDHEEIVEVMGDAAGETSDSFHLLRLAQLLLEPAALGDVFHEEFECSSGFAVGNDAGRNSRQDGAAVGTYQFGGEIVEFLARMKVVGGLEPLLRVGVEAA